jgi:hypothetical protein
MKIIRKGRQVQIEYIGICKTCNCKFSVTKDEMEPLQDSGSPTCEWGYKCPNCREWVYFKI